MNRPLIVSLIGWLGILAALAALALLTFGFSFFNLREFLVGELTAVLPNLSVNALIGGCYGLIVLFSIPNYALLKGAAWARIYFTLIHGSSILLAVMLLFIYHGKDSALAMFHLGDLCTRAGFSILIISLLYSPACNLFFHSGKDPIPFSHYETLRQLILLTAIALVAFGGYRIWGIATGRIPTPAVATAVDPKAPKPIRTFTNTSGVGIRARLIYFDGAQVILEREDGRRFNNPITLYSEPDQAYIRRESPR